MRRNPKHNQPTPPTPEQEQAAEVKAQGIVMLVLGALILAIISCIASPFVWAFSKVITSIRFW